MLFLYFFFCVYTFCCAWFIYNHFLVECARGFCEKALCWAPSDIYLLLLSVLLLYCSVSSAAIKSTRRCEVIESIKNNSGVRSSRLHRETSAALQP